MSGSFEGSQPLVKLVPILLSVEVIMRSLRTSPGGTRSEARQEALAWLAAQLRWERALDRLRSSEDETPIAQAA